MRHRLADAERITDGEHQIAHLEIVAVGELKRVEAAVAAFEFQNGDIRFLVLQHNVRVEFALVGEHHLDFGIATDFDDVGVGDHQAVRVNDHSGA